jgi:hypothetical protein
MANNWPANPADVYAHTTRFTGQLNSLATQTLLTAPPPDLYFVDIYLECPVAGAAGTVLVTVAYTDSLGVANQLTGAFALTSATPLTAHLAARLTLLVASGDITFTTTVAGAVGGPQYNITIRAQRAPSTV